MKPMLASDAVEEKIHFPCLAQPKIDGVRGCNLDGVFTGRSLKCHANKYTTRSFSHRWFLGMDGEVAAEHHTHPDLCRLTTSALNRIEGEPYTLWWLFDLVTERTRFMPYEDRQRLLAEYVAQIVRENVCPEVHRLRVVPTVRVVNLQQLLDLDSQWLDEGYEGSIVRDPNGKYKEGRSTVREGGLLRIKRFIEEDAVVLSLVQGEHNTNEAKFNELGLQERSSHQAGMVPNGQIGSLLCRTVKEGKEITVAPGKMPVPEREHYWQHPEQIVGEIIKYKHFPKGVKDKPRFPTFQSFRAASDVVN